MVVSDGEENKGDLEAAAMMAAANDVQISTLGLERPDTPEVLVSDVQAPARARAGDSFEIQISVNSTVDTEATLRLLGDGAVLKEEAVQLRPGENTFVVSVTVPERGFRTFSASVSTPTGVDTAFQNNELSAFTDVAGPAAALILEGTPGEGANLASALEADGIQVSVLPADQAPADLPSYASYDATLLVNVPASTLGQTMLTLQSYVRDLGRGLITVGGDSSYGLGGYFNTPLEETLAGPDGYPGPPEPAPGQRRFLHRQVGLDGTLPRRRHRQPARSNPACPRPTWPRRQPTRRSSCSAPAMKSALSPSTTKPSGSRRLCLCPSSQISPPPWPGFSPRAERTSTPA